MAATIIGTALDFGVPDDVDSLITQSVSRTLKSDTAMVRNKEGNVVTKAFYNQNEEVSVEGYGSSTLAPSDVVAVTGAVYDLHVDEVTFDEENEDFVKSSIKATGFEGIVLP